jgi:hypothetical protein
MVDDNDDDDDFGAIGGMRVGKGNEMTRRNPSPLPLCSPQTSHGLTWTRTRSAAM